MNSRAQGQRFRALPGVQSAALTSVLPLGGDSDMDVTIEGHGPTRPGEETTTSVDSICGKVTGSLS